MSIWDEVSDPTHHSDGEPVKKDRSKMRSAIGSAGADLNRSSVERLQDLAREAGERSVPSYKRGGRMKKSGAARLHKGEGISRSKGRKKARSGGR